MKTAVISVTKSADKIADKLSRVIELDLYSKYRSENFNINSISKFAFENYKAIIYISSTGIAVRSAAPYLKGKDKDPGVVVIDSSGRFSISLVSGHIGGANELAKRAAKIIGAVPVITTATDNLNIIAPDIIAVNNNLIIDNIKDAKDIAALLIQGKNAAFIDFKGEIKTPEGYTENYENIDGIVYVTNKIENEIPKDIKSLKLIRKDIVLGIGCRKNFSPDEILGTVLNSLALANIDSRAVKKIATIDIKDREEAILKLSKYLECELRLFTVDEILKVQDKYEKSSFVEKSVGVTSVCEPCVELAGANIIKGKAKHNGMTICIGQLK